MSLRTRLARHLDPQHAPEAYAQRERELLDKVMRMQRTVRSARPPLLVVAYEREALTLAAQDRPIRAVSVQQILQGRTRGMTIHGYLPTNLARQHARWHEAKALLDLSHVANNI